MFGNLKNRINNWMNPKEKYSSEILYKVLYGQVDKLPDTEELECISGLDFDKRPVQVAVIHVGNDNCKSERLNTLMESCKSTSGSDEVLPVSDGCSQVILLFFCDTVWEDQARDMLEDIQKEFLAAYPDGRLYITLGAVVDYTEDGEPAWRKSFKTAVGLQDYRYVKQKGKIISYSDIVTRRQIYPKGVHFRFDLLKQYLEADSPDLLRGWLSGVYSMLSGEGMDVLGLRYHLTLEIIVNTVSIFRENGHYAEEYIEPPEVLIEKILSIETPQGMQQWTEAFLEKCRSSIKKARDH